MQHVTEQAQQPFRISIEPKGAARGVAWQSLNTFSQGLRALLTRIDAKHTRLGHPTTEYEVTGACWDHALALWLTPHPIIEDVPPTQPVRRLIEGVESIEREHRLPVFFDEPEVRLTSRMLGPLLRNGIARVKLTMGEQELALGPDLSDETRRLYEEETRYAKREHTTVDGELRKIALRGSKGRGEFQILDRSSDRFVRFGVQKEKVQEIATLIGKRLRVSGEARLAYDGRPKSIQAEQIEVVQEEGLPSLTDIYNAGLRLSGDSVEMIRELRSA